MDLCLFSLNREVDKVLSGLEILSKVFDQQSAFMVSKMIQQVCLFILHLWLCVCVCVYTRSQLFTFKKFDGSPETLPLL